MTFTINKGCHYCFHLMRIWWNRDHFTWRFLFEKECYWDIPRNDDDYDLNKLVGVSFGLDNHRNSIRLAWRPEFGSSGNIALYAYQYDRTQTGHQSYYLGLVGVNQWHTATIQVLTGSYVIRLNDGLPKIIQKCSKLSKLQFMQFPYFGGNNTAPCKMKIQIT